MQLDRETVNQIVAALTADLEANRLDIGGGDAHVKHLIEGTRTSVETLIEAMRMHTDALKATNDVLFSLIKRVRALEERVGKEKPPAV